MSRQDKATTEKHTKMLREMVRRPENKLCADCKRNDPRWASWNLGVFMCIRCSGIHRGMGTHISKVKSVDLDTWTPDQMDSIRKWGNHRANLYWEAHLKPGHTPPEHKMESFIRSKYESRRWALDGPPPSDPSVLEGDTSEEPPTSPQTNSPSTTPQSPITARPQSGSAPQPRQLLSVTAGMSQQPIPISAPMQTQSSKLGDNPPPAPQDDLFSLDFHSPPLPTTPHGRMQQTPRKDVKNDILSLFSAPVPSTSANAASNFGQFSAVQPSPPTVVDPFGQWSPASPQQSQSRPPVTPVTSLTGTSGTGQWGIQSGWNAPALHVPPPQSNVWGNSPVSSRTPQQQQVNGQGLFETQSVWGSPTTTSSGINNISETAGGLFSPSLSSGPTIDTGSQKKDDAFGDIWGGFK